MTEDEDKIELSRETVGQLGSEPRDTTNPLSTLADLCGEPVTVPTHVITGTIVTEGDCQPRLHGQVPPGDPVEKVDVVDIIEEIEIREEP